jgi:uncharacterized repeat protein (TIGR01451 family)
VHPRVAGSASSTAVVAGATHDPDAGNNSASATTLIRSADLSLTKAASPDPAVLGKPLTYTLRAHNAGPTRADAVRVVDPLPTGVDLVSATATAGSCDLGPTVTCELGAMEAGGSATIRIVVRPRRSGRIENIGSISSADPDRRADDDRGSAVTVVRTANLAVRLIGTPDPVVAGGVIRYVATVTNRGPGMASGTEFVFEPPPTGRPVEVPEECTAGGTNIRCKLGSVAPLASKSVGIGIRATTAGTLRATARAAAEDPDPDPSDNEASLVTEAVYAPRLVIAPSLGTPGSVATAIGTGFPPNAPVALRWRPGVGGLLLTTSGGGTFRVSVLVFPRDVLGPRLLVASPTGNSSFGSVTQPFLVVPGTIAPSGFVQRR